MAAYLFPVLITYLPTWLGSFIFTAKDPFELSFDSSLILFFFGGKTWKHDLRRTQGKYLFKFSSLHRIDGFGEMQSVKSTSLNAAIMHVFFFNSLLFSFPRNAKYPDTTLNHLLFPKYLVPPSRFRYVFHWFFSLFRHQCFPLIWVIIIFKNSNFVNLEISEWQVIERYQEGTSTFWPEAVERFNLSFWNFVGW